MFTKFEHFAATSLMGTRESPPRHNGQLYFQRDWEQAAFSIAIALSKQGHYEWETFRQHLMAAIGEWEATHKLDDPSWDYYQCWLSALEKLAIESGIIDRDKLDKRVSNLLK